LGSLQRPERQLRERKIEKARTLGQVQCDHECGVTVPFIRDWNHAYSWQPFWRVDRLYGEWTGYTESGQAINGVNCECRNSLEECWESIGM
jgi:hypothetical protein